MNFMLNMTNESFNDKKLDKFERWNHILSVIIGHYLRFSKKYHFLGCFLLLSKEKILRNQISFIKCPIYRNILPQVRPLKVKF